MVEQNPNHHLQVSGVGSHLRPDSLVHPGSAEAAHYNSGVLLGGAHGGAHHGTHAHSHAHGSGVHHGTHAHGHSKNASPTRHHMHDHTPASVVYLSSSIFPPLVKKLEVCEEIVHTLERALPNDEHKLRKVEKETIEQLRKFIRMMVRDIGPK